MHFCIDDYVEEVPAGQDLLDLDKNKCGVWRPGDDMPGWWGQTGSVCGGTVACKEEDGVMHYVPVLCKRWSCDVCSYYRYAWLVRNIAEAIRCKDLRYMWTLTLRAGDRDTEQSFQDLQAAWRKLRGRIKTEYGGLDFVWVVETTKAGVAHMHVLVDRRLDWAWMSAAWLKCTGDSMVVRFDKVRDAGAAAYIAKYVGKEVRQRRLDGIELKSRHLFGTSRNVRFSDFMPKGDGWTVVQSAWSVNAAWLQKNAVVLEYRRDGVPRMTVAMSGCNVRLKAWEIADDREKERCNGNSNGIRRE